MKVAEETTAVCTEEIEEEDVSTSETPPTGMDTFKIPVWVQFFQRFTQGVGLCIGVILALPFIAISGAISWCCSWYRSLKDKDEK